MGLKQFLALIFVPLLAVLALALPAAEGRSTVPRAAASVVFVDSEQNLGGDAPSTAVALGDVDGDGDVDALVANDGGGPEIWLNDGGLQGGTEGVFVDGDQTLGTEAAVDVALADLDGDDDLDIFFLVLSLNTANRVWLNQGGVQGGNEGTFAFSGQDFGALGITLALGDVDGDGDVDAFVGVDNGDPGQVWLNDGNGAFTDSGQNVDVPAVDAALADLDGDGDLDLFTVMDGVDRANRVGINQGGAQNGTAGEFADSGQSLGDGASSAVALGDVDGDGDVDAFVANNGANRLWINQGGAQAGDEGAFQEGAELSSGESAAVALADLDGDGDLDAFVANAGANLVWVNQGGAEGGSEGTFVDNGQSLGAALSEGLDLGDVDGDGDLDAFVANYGSPNKVWLNAAAGADGPRHFVVAGRDLVSDLTFNLDGALADLDGDGDLDLALNQTGAFELFENDGTGTMNSRGRFDLESGGGQVEVGDFDGDGDSDMLVGGMGSVLLNDGAGNFSDGAPLPDVAYRYAAGDLDGDGDLDALVHVPGDDVQVWLNQGGAQGGTAGAFADTGQRLDGWEILDIGDVDGDGDLDAVVLRDAYLPQLWLNQGGAQGGQPDAFADSGQIIGRPYLGDVVLGDVDGDGDLDAFVARWHADAEEGPPAEVWLNEGGVFTDSGQQLGSGRSFTAALADVDLDGDLDAVVIDDDGGQIWLNSGSAQGGQAGTFAAGEPFLAERTARWMTLGDLDGDGYPDGVGGSEPLLWLNRPRPGSGTAGFLHQNLPQDGDGHFIYDWWVLGNAEVPVALNQTLSIGRDMPVFTHYPFGTTPPRSYDDALQFPAGDVLDRVTAGAEREGGEPDQIWNPYFGTNPDFGATVEVDVFLDGTDFLAVEGSDTLTVVFHNLDSTLRRCFLEGMEHLIDRLLPDTAAAGFPLARLESLPGPVDLELFRSVRDDVMAETLQGRYYATLYETHSPELLQITTRNLTLLSEIGRGLDTWSPLLQALVEGNGDTATITPEMVEHVLFLLEAYEGQASPELANVIRQEREALDLRAFAGLTMDEALARVNERQVDAQFLPVIRGD